MARLEVDLVLVVRRPSLDGVAAGESLHLGGGYPRVLIGLRGYDHAAAHQGEQIRRRPGRGAVELLLEQQLRADRPTEIAKDRAQCLKHGALAVAALTDKAADKMLGAQAGGRISEHGMDQAHDLLVVEVDGGKKFLPLRAGLVDALPFGGHRVEDIVVGEALNDLTGGQVDHGVGAGEQHRFLVQLLTDNRQALVTEPVGVVAAGPGALQGAQLIDAMLVLGDQGGEYLRLGVVIGAAQLVNTVLQIGGIALIILRHLLHRVDIAVLFVELPVVSCPVQPGGKFLDIDQAVLVYSGKEQAVAAFVQPETFRDKTRGNAGVVRAVVGRVQAKDLFFDLPCIVNFFAHLGECLLINHARPPLIIDDLSTEAQATAGHPAAKNPAR